MNTFFFTQKGKEMVIYTSGRLFPKISTFLKCSFGIIYLISQLSCLSSFRVTCLVHSLAWQWRKKFKRYLALGTVLIRQPSFLLMQMWGPRHWLSSWTITALCLLFWEFSESKVTFGLFYKLTESREFDAKWSLARTNTDCHGLN